MAEKIDIFFSREHHRSLKQKTKTKIKFMRKQRRLSKFLTNDECFFEALPRELGGVPKLGSHKVVP